MSRPFELPGGKPTDLNANRIWEQIIGAVVSGIVIALVIGLVGYLVIIPGIQKELAATIKAVDRNTERLELAANSTTRIQTEIINMSRDIDRIETQQVAQSGTLQEFGQELAAVKALVRASARGAGIGVN